jgi:hypothetical protein
MKNPIKRDSIRGSALLAAMLVIVILTFAAAGILSYSLTTYRNSVRQAMLDQGKEIADSEMENLYYNWKNLLLKKTSVGNVVADLGASGSGLTTSTIPFDQTLVRSVNGWTVTRFLQYNQIHTNSGAATGIVAGTNQVGNIYFYLAKTSATVNLPLLGNVTYKSGRTFEYSNTSLFQFAVFYQGNLEMAAGSNMTIGGPVSTNASAFLGAQSNNGNPFTLSLTDTVYYFQNYNGAADPLSGSTDYIPMTNPSLDPSLVDPVYNPGAADTPVQTAPANQTAQRAIQVSKLAAQASFVGGVDVAADIANPAYAAAYTNLQGQVDPNEVYRAVIAPPPLDSSGNLLPEDQTVAGSRMYNTAGIVITITQTSGSGSTPAVTGSGGNTTINCGISPWATNPPNPNNLTMYNNETWAQPIVNPTATGTTYPVVKSVRQMIQDPREVLNGSTGVNLTTVDVGALNIALQTGAMTNHDLATNYNGVVYVYDNTNNSTDNSHSNNPPLNATANLNGILLTNGSTTPYFTDQNGIPIGFSVVSDNGVYVQGDYNKTQHIINGMSYDNPSSIMGDAITAVSAGWNTGTAISASAGGSTVTSFSQREAVESGETLPTPSASNPINADDLGTHFGMTVNAAILTGNTPTSGNSTSGGAQNLVRMIEDWYYPYTPAGNPTNVTGQANEQVPLPAGVGMTLTLNGSLGQIFTSKYFSGGYASGTQNGLGAGNRVYIQPKTRNFNFDSVFKAGYTPASSPSTTGFARGPFFNW